MDMFANVTEVSRVPSATPTPRVASLAEQAATNLMDQYFITTRGRARAWLVFDRRTQGGLLFLVGSMRPHTRKLKRVAPLLGVAEVEPTREFYDTLCSHGPEGFICDGIRVTRAGH
jgi:hypothetical protein